MPGLRWPGLLEGIGFMKDEWVRVSKSAPCKVCERPNWCGFSADGQRARCMRAQNDHPSTGRDGSVGWIWKLTEPIPTDIVEAERKKKSHRRLSLEEVAVLHERHFHHPNAESMREKEAERLGVSLGVLRRMEVGIGWTDERAEEYSSWPCRDATGAVVGLTRRFTGGRKLTYPGTSNSGIFLPDHWWLPMGPVFIVEGGSDTAALASANLCVMGRPSNVGGANHVASLIGRRKPGAMCYVVTEMDEKDTSRIPARLNHPDGCNGCRLCWPGYSGALSVAQQLQRLLGGHTEAQVVFPPRGFKDVQHAWGTRPDLIEAWLDEQNLLKKTGFRAPM